MNFDNLITMILKENDTFETGGRIKTIKIPTKNKYDKNRISLDFDGPNAQPTRFSKNPLVTIIWQITDKTGKSKADWVTWDIQDHKPEEFLVVLEPLANFIQKVTGQMKTKVLNDLLKFNTKKLLTKIGGVPYSYR